MQTFLPYPSFVRSAQCLDRQRLGKQRVECLQILQALLLHKGGGWTNHPATRMWRGYERMLAQYGIAMCDEWVRRGYKDTCQRKIAALGRRAPQSSNCKPRWLGLSKFHASHRSNLLRKDWYWYGHYRWKEPDDLPYVWPKEKPR